MKSYVFGGLPVDFLVSGFTDGEVQSMKQMLAEIRAKYPWETDQRLLSMAITRLFVDLVDPAIAEDYPSPEDLAEMRNGASPKETTEQDRARIHNDLRKVFSAHLTQV
ncbi:hypothetical protein H7F10_06910 [Acidithiobacillus sp. HP-6]|uniref:hypothetical protein n=1 Tax=unclassified Acidithiobacillus TaxID=2614800 RepID=UPI00187A2676|nr:MULTISPECIES: hypothetical protein [unclassified Acidithiobacillus]MBE7562684.1 hypothetical protein [Acidithiobacillus sp. HP-6]MBE7570520.1 hypothetical protein [Acidithiobacillus sp. HP-2]